MSIGRPIPEIWLFQTLTLKLQGHGHGCGQRARSYSWPSILLISFLFISHQSDQKFLSYSYFEIWPWNIQGQGHEWGQRARSHSIPSIQPMHFLFVSYQSDQPFLRYGQNNVEKTRHKFRKKNCQINSFQQNSSRIYTDTNNDLGNITVLFCSDWMSGSYFIVPTSKFLLIDATTMILGQGHRKVIQYISPDLYILCSKYQRFSSNGFDVRGKSHCSGGCSADELKTESHPRPRWLYDG